MSHRRMFAQTSAIAAALALVPAARAMADTQTFALIVTNNHSAAMDRPDLQYADDDGARYYQLFEALRTPHVSLLLTAFDRPTAQEHPELVAVARPPRKAALTLAVNDLRDKVAEARRRGDKTAFYFVFAGHGDVRGGKGRLELEDSDIDGDYLEHEIIERIGADVDHILLDSCNSFFVLNPRKPGGRRWATPADMTQGFAHRHPNVGVLLSTNAEAEVYEWSQLEAGVFSHEVRSGLTGAADVNGDGQVTYDELAAFIETANRQVPSAQYRPHVYYRGPAGAGDATFFPSSQLSGRSVVLSTAQQRLWLRHAEGHRLLDLHKEPGALRVTLPQAANGPLLAYELAPATGPEVRPRVLEYRIDPGAEPVELALLSPSAPGDATRGADGVFAHLFAEAYGPRAYGAFLRTGITSAPPVYGVSLQDRARARHYIDAIAETGRSQRMFSGSILAATTAALWAGATASYLSDPSNADNRTGAAVLGGLGGLTLVGSVLSFAVSSDEEDLKDEFELKLRSDQGDWQAVIAQMDQSLERLAETRRRHRRIGAWVGGIGGGLMAATGVAQVVSAGDAATPQERNDRRVSGAVAAALGVGFGAASVALSLRESPTERLIHLYRQDPGLQLELQPTPVAGAGMGIALSGTF